MSGCGQEVGGYPSFSGYQVNLITDQVKSMELSNTTSGAIQQDSFQTLLLLHCGHGEGRKDLGGRTGAVQGAPQWLSVWRPSRRCCWSRERYSKMSPQNVSGSVCVSFLANDYKWTGSLWSTRPGVKRGTKHARNLSRCVWHYRWWDRVTAAVTVVWLLMSQWKH